MITVTGHLGKFIYKKYGVDPKNINIIAKSAGECIRALEANFPGFKSMINRKGYYKVIAGDSENDDVNSLGEDELLLSFENKNWYIVPLAAGAGGKGGIMQMVLGAILIVVGIVLTVGSYGTLSEFGVPMIMAGAGMMIGGLVTMLTPVPKIPKSNKDDSSSFLFNGAANADEPGTTIPVAYGETFVGSIVASFGVTVEG